MATRPRRAWRNVLTYTGGILVALSLLFIVNLLFLDLVTPEPSAYLGMFTFLILPVVLILGVLLIVVGLLFARFRMWWRNGEEGTVEYYPRIDLNLPGHRKVLMIVAGAICLMIPFVGFMSYEGYHYTDSNEFCGRVCHQVMKPQYVAHERSPHSRVECATCHIGRGASWYVKSKLSGLRQVKAVLLDSYPRPIPPAIRELRPARETCERCHWPQKFYGNQLITINHFAADEASTPRPIQMMMKTGGNDPSVAPPSGVHWHMALGHTIEFIATDEALQDIPWVRATDHETGAQRIYRSDGLTSKDPPPDGQL
ncbi:MAG: cytochrome C, partial [Deltaproteobacteria bacterium]